MYKFVYDEKELKKFYDTIVPKLEDFEVLFLSLSCRKKYLSEEERAKYHITRAEMFDRKLVRKNEWERFSRTIRKYEVNEGGYLTKNNISVPPKCMVIYFNINPSNSLKALKEFNSKLVDWQYELLNGNKESFKDKFNKLDVELMNCYQRNRGRKIWMDIDFDVPKEFNAPEIMKDYLRSTNLRFYWVDTKSGNHLLIDRSTLDFNPNDICHYGLRKLWEYWQSKAESGEVSYPIKQVLASNKIIVGNYAHVNEIIVNKNEMIPCPGTLQGGYPVRILWDYSKESNE